MKITTQKDILEHTFKPIDFSSDWCEICEQNFRHYIHLRTPKTN